LARERSADERKYLDEVLAWFPMPVVTTESCEYWAFRPAPVLARWQDEPHTPPYAARLEAELEAARDRGIGAILAGSGGDEVGGSSCYLFDLLIRGNIARFWPELRARARGKGQSGWTLLAELIRRCGAAITSAGASRSVRAPCWMHPELAQRLRVRYRTRRDGWYNPARCDMLGRLSYCWTDPMLSSMGQLYDYYGVELRQPFLDRRVVEWALMVPPFRFGEDGLLKAPLRKALADLMPPAITLRADKANYLYYWDLGVRVHERDRIVQMLDSSVAHHNGLIDAAKLRFEYDRYCRGAAIDRRSLWRALTMEAWLRKASN
jgi:asparagine synthase (glutamine-hydrolysing)